MSDAPAASPAPPAKAAIDAIPAAAPAPKRRRWPALVGLVVAIGAESIAVHGAIIDVREPLALAGYAAAHLVASVSIGFFAWWFVPPQFREPRLGVIAFLAMMAFFVPILGMIGFVIGTLFVYSARHVDDKRRFAVVDEPEFVVSRLSQGVSMRSSNAREDLADAALSEDLRLKALLSVQDMPGRVAGALLHDLLGDPSDEMRLLAYGMLRSKERDIAQRIIAATERRLEATDNRSKYLASRELAELNWEFIYQNLVSGDMRRHVTRHGFNYAIEAIQIADDDPGLWFVAGRLAMSSRQLASARYCLQGALDRGFPEVRVLPLLAECAFYERKFDEVFGFLHRMPANETAPGFEPVLQYWTW